MSERFAVTVVCARCRTLTPSCSKPWPQIEAAFEDSPRPSNDALLHERCSDDNDIAQLYPVTHWREIPDELVESEYAACRS